MNAIFHLILLFLPLLGARDRIELTHSHHIQFPSSPEFQAFLFHPDGKRGFALVHAEVIDVWDVLLFHWPWTLGIIAALLAIPPLWLALRTLRRPRSLEHVYCRRCNYDVTPEQSTTPSIRCPECGVDASRRLPVHGRRLRWRLALPVALLAVLAAGYAAPWAFGLSRTGPAIKWADWYSHDLTVWARQQSIPQLIKHIKPGEILLEIDLESGSTTRTVCARASKTYFTPTLAPDGESIFLIDAYSGIAQISTRTGRTLASIRIGTDARFEMDHRAIIEFLDDGTTALVAYLAEDTKMTRVAAWDIKTGTTRIILEAPAFISMGSPYTRIIQCVPGTNGTRFLDSPNFMEAHGASVYHMRVHDIESTDIVNVVQTAKVSPNVAPQVANDGSRAFLLIDYGARFIVHDLTTGKEIPSPPVPPRLGANSFALSVDDRFVYLPIHPKWIAVGELETRRWAARLSHPSELYALDLLPSLDGGWLAAIGQRTRSGGGFAHDLVLWDIRKLND